MCKKVGEEDKKKFALTTVIFAQTKSSMKPFEDHDVLHTVV